MKRLHHILRVTIMLAVAVAPLGGAYAGIDAKAGSDTGSHCAKMGAKMKIDNGPFCKHHNMDDSTSGMKCEKDCNDCKAAHHVASLSHCPMHNSKMETGSSQSASSSPHACPHNKTLQPPKQ